MTEENQVQQVMKEPQQIMKEPQGEAAQLPSGAQPAQRVTTKNLKKVEAGKRVAAHNHKKREVKEREEQVKLEKTASRVNQYYGIGAVIALGVIGGLGYHIYLTKKGDQPSNPQQNNPKPHPQVIAAQPQSNKFEMD